MNLTLLHKHLFSIYRLLGPGGVPLRERHADHAELCRDGVERTREGERVQRAVPSQLHPGEGSDRPEEVR